VVVVVAVEVVVDSSGGGGGRNYWHTCCNDALTLHREAASRWADVAMYSMLLTKPLAITVIVVAWAVCMRNLSAAALAASS